MQHSQAIQHNTQSNTLHQQQLQNVLPSQATTTSQLHQLNAADAVQLQV